MDENLGDGRMEPVALYATLCVIDIREGGEQGSCILYFVSDTHIHTHLIYIYIYIYIYIQSSPQNRPRKPRGKVEAQLYSFFNLGTRGVGGQRHTPAALPSGKTRYLLYKRLGEIQGRSGQVWKISPPPRFDPRTVQPVASRYTD